MAKGETVKYKGLEIGFDDFDMSDFDPEAGKINQALEGDPALVNRDPYGEGWMIKLQLRNTADLDQLLTAVDYAQHVGE